MLRFFSCLSSDGTEFVAVHVCAGKNHSRQRHHVAWAKPRLDADYDLANQCEAQNTGDLYCPE